MKNFQGFLIVCIILTCLVCKDPDETPEVPEPVILAEYHVWHGLSNHQYPPYNSGDIDIICNHILKAKTLGIHGFVVNWYGPETGVANDTERAFIDQATAELLNQAATRDFWVSLMYDEGTVLSAEDANTANYTARVISDLTYASQYFGYNAFLKVNDKPCIFVFPYDSGNMIVDQYIDWTLVRSSLAWEIILIDKDPNPADPEHDACFDGFFAWVQATNGEWDTHGQEWGEVYLQWFYNTMLGDYSHYIAVGGVWPGFDDSLASWSKNRYISRMEHTTYDNTMYMARQNKVPFILVATWNDFEEATDIEFGVLMELDMDDEDTAIFNSADTALLRSSPVKINWNPDRGQLDLQFYKDGILLYNQPHAPGDFFELLPGNNVYEVKLWTSGSTAISRWIRTRASDPIPETTPFVVDD